MAAATLASLAFHAVLVAGLALRQGRSSPTRAPVATAPVVEVEIVAAPTPTPKPARPLPVRRAPAPALEQRRAAGPPGGERKPPPAAASAGAGAGAGVSRTPAVAEAPATQEDVGPARGDLPRGLAVLGPGRAAAEALAPPEVDAGVTRRSADPVPPPDLALEAREVRQRVDGMLSRARDEHRLATLGFDTEALELGRAFERAAVTAPREVERPWIQAALAAYREELQRAAGRRRIPEPAGDSRESALEEHKDLARQGAALSSGRYVALIEVRQGADGRLAELRLLASSGVRAFDERALGCVARGLDAPVPAAGAARLALWEFDGEKLPDSKLVEGVKKAYRYALLDVVPLKETIVEVDRAGSVERLIFTARLLAVY